MPNTKENMEIGMQIAEWHLSAVREVASVNGKYSEKAVYGCMVSLAAKIMIALDNCENRCEKSVSVKSDC